MPLITIISDQNTKESDLFKKVSIETTTLNPKHLDLYCEHKKAVVNWKFTSCT